MAMKPVRIPAATVRRMVDSVAEGNRAVLVGCVDEDVDG